MPVSPKDKSELLYLPNTGIPSKVFPLSCLCTCPEKSPCNTITSPALTKVSVQEGFIPRTSENSKPCSLATQVIPLVRQPVEGSGFSVVLRINDGGESAPYSLKGFQLEYTLGARR